MKYMKFLTDRTRKDNNDAMKIIVSRGVKKIPLAPGELDRFKEILNQAITEVDPRSLPKETLEKVRNTLKEYRAS